MTSTSTPTPLDLDPAAVPTPAPPTPAATGSQRTPYPHGRRWPFWLCALVACVLMFADYVVAAPLAVVFNRVLGSNTSQNVGNGVTVLLCLVTLATALGLVALATRCSLREQLHDIGWVWTRDSWWLFGLGWALVAIAVVPAQLLSLPGGLTRPVVEPSVTAGLAFAPATLAVVARLTQALPLQGMPEELVWRGWLMNCLRERPRVALTVSCVVFGCLHFVSGGGQQNLAEHFVYCLQAMGFAFLAGALALRMRSLWCAIGVHSGMHITNMLLTYSPHRVTGPGSWALQAVISSVIALLVLREHTPSRVRYER